MADQKISARDLLTGTGVVSTPAVRAGSTTDYRIVDNLSATTDPGVGDDSADGFHVGSRWFNTSAGRVWMCTDATGGAAVWKRQMVVDDNLAGVTAATARSNIGAWAKLWKPYRTGTYHWPFGYKIGSSSLAVASANTLYLFPVIFPADVTISDLFVRVSTGSAGNWQAAIYNADQSTFHPTTLVAKSSASASTGSSTTVVAAGGLNTNPTLTEGVLYFFAFNSDTATPTYHALDPTGNLYGLSSFLGTTTLANVDQSGQSFVNGYSIASVALGTWGDLSAATLVETFLSGGIPLIGFKVA